MILQGNYAISFETYCKMERKRFDYRIAIPSYKRQDTLSKKTMSVLQRGGINPNRVDIFVADQDELRRYRETLNKNTYSRIVVGYPGVKRIRNFMQDYYQEGEYVFFIDDDIESVYIVGADGKCRTDFDLDALINYGFQISEEMAGSIWGIQACDNPFFMKRQISGGLKYICAGFHGQRITHHSSAYVTVDDKEDFERSVNAYLRDGTVTRLDYVGIKTKCYTERGGMQVERTRARIEADARKLIQKYPLLVHENKARKKHFEVKLVDKRAGYSNLSKIKFKLLDK